MRLMARGHGLPPAQLSDVADGYGSPAPLGDSAGGFGSPAQLGGLAGMSCRPLLESWLTRQVEGRRRRIAGLSSQAVLIGIMYLLGMGC